MARALHRLNITPFYLSGRPSTFSSVLPFFVTGISPFPLFLPIIPCSRFALVPIIPFLSFSLVSSSRASRLFFLPTKPWESLWRIEFLNYLDIILILFYIVFVFILFRTFCHNIIIIFLSKIQLVVYHQSCVLIGWATTRLYVIDH